MFANENVQKRIIGLRRKTIRILHLWKSTIVQKTLQIPLIYYTIYVIKPFIIKKQNPDMAWL